MESTVSGMEGKQQRRPRREFTEEFKSQACRLVLDEGKSLMQVSRDLDVHPNSLREWVKRERANRDGGKSGLTTEERAELAQLRRENRTLKMEREILKKAAAFFAKNQT